MKYRSSSRPMRSKTSRRTIRLAPETQSVGPGLVLHRRGDAPAPEQLADGSQAHPALELARDRVKAERRHLRRTVGVFEPAPGDADVAALVHEADEFRNGRPGGRSCRG
jgi:hypothetical protein